MIIPTTKKVPDIHTPTCNVCTNAGVCYTLTQSETGKQNKKGETVPEAERYTAGADGRAP